MTIKQVRESRGYSQLVIAAALGMDVPLVSKIERYRCLPIPKDMEILTELLDCEISDLYTSKEITFRKEKEKERKSEDVYKVCVRFPSETKVRIKELFKECGYHSVSDWVYACFRRLEKQAEIIKKARAVKGTTTQARNKKM